MRSRGGGASVVLALSLAELAADGGAADLRAAPPGRLPSAVDTMRTLFADIGPPAVVTHDATDTTGHRLTELAVAALSPLTAAAHTNSRGRSAGARYVGVSTTAAGVQVSTSDDLARWTPSAVIALPAGAAAPHLVAVTGRAPNASQWWVMALETGDTVATVLFMSTPALLGGNAARTFVCPKAPVVPSGGRTPVPALSYFGPTVLAAVHSRRDKRSTVDVVLSVAWVDVDGATHVANALIDALSPDAWTAPAFRPFVGYQGETYAPRSSFAGPLRWEAKLRDAVKGFSYTGSAMAYVPCGPGCGDPRDRAGGNVDGLPGVVKVSVVGGTADDRRGRLLLWAWDPIAKAAWLWPSGFGTGQGGFANNATELVLPNVSLAERPDPRVAVLPCPGGGVAATRGDTVPLGPLCLWVGVTVADPLGARTAFWKPLETQALHRSSPGDARFAPRFTTSVRPPRPAAPRTADDVARRSRVRDGPTRSGLVLKNDAFEVTVAADGASFTVTPLRNGPASTFNSTFAVVISAADPKLSDVVDAGTGATSRSSLYHVADDVPLFWRARRTANPLRAGDTAARETASRCSAANSTAIALHFPRSGDAFGLAAELSLPAGSAFPRLRWTLTAAAKAFFSAAFVGSPAVPPNATLGFSQPANCFNSDPTPPFKAACPLNESSVVADASANLPYAMVSAANGPATDTGTNVALVADPASTIPFEPCAPWPDHPPQFSGTCPAATCGDSAAPDACSNRGWASQARSALGVHDGAVARPVLWAPVLGGFGSQMAAGTTHTFTVHLVVHHGTPSETYRLAATEVHGFRDERDNSGPGSLSATLERMGSYLADTDGANLLQWDAVQKYSFYFMDDPCAFKPLEYMSALSVSLVTDDDRMYSLFARETVKFALSRSDRDHFLWPYRLTVGIGSYAPGKAPVHLGMAQNHGGGFASAAEALQVWRLTGRHTPATVRFARETGFDPALPCPDADSAYDALQYYHASVDADERQRWWNCTLQIARQLTMWPQGPKRGQPVAASSQKCANADFFVSLFEITGDAAHRTAAQQCAANCEASYQVFPRASSAGGAAVAVDAGNQSLSYWWTHGRWGSWGWPGGELPMWAREQTVPTWRASHNGIKVSGGGGGGGWLATHSLDSPVKMLRVATLGNDSFARALVRWSLVGRFGSFPGDFQGKPKHTLVWESDDMAEHILPKETQTTWNTGHFWPVAGTVLDFLLTDAADRSNNAVLFPSSFLGIIPFGRMYSPALGPGAVYGEAATPWIPSGLFTDVDNAQFDWAAAYSDSAVFVVLLSQSWSDEAVSCTLNPSLVSGLDVPGGINASLRVNNGPPKSVSVEGGQFSVTVPSKGLAVLRLGGATAKTRLQQKVLATGLPPLDPNASRVVNATGGPFGVVTAMALRWGANMTELYVFMQANSTLFADVVAKDRFATSHTVFDSVALNYSVDGGEQQSVVATVFPFDFTVPLEDGCGRVEFSLEGTSSAGVVERTASATVVVTGGGGGVGRGDGGKATGARS